MSFFQYVCNETHFDGSKLFKKGLPYIFASNPGSKFDLISQQTEELFLKGYVDADGTFYQGVINYDDWKFPATRVRLGAQSKPDFDYTNIGLLFPQNDAAEKIYIGEVTSHRVYTAPGAKWYPHVHYIQDEAEIPTFKMQYRIYAAGAAVPSFETAVETDGSPVFTYTSGSLNQILSFPEIDAWTKGATGIANHVDIILWREDNDVTGDVLVKEFDIHLPFDAPLGSGQEFIK